MLIRVVKLSIKTESIEAFLANFEQVRSTIIGFEGCHYLELLQDSGNSNTFFTYSHWESEEHLESYRNSPIFSDIWRTTKTMFDQPAQAWSLDSIDQLGTWQTDNQNR